MANNKSKIIQSPEKIKQNLAELSRQIKRYNYQLKKGEKVIGLIEKYNNLFQNFKVRDGKGLEELLNYSEEIKTAIENTKNSAAESLRLANQYLADVSPKIDEMNKAYGTFTSIRDQVDNPESGLQTVFNKSSEFFSQIGQTQSKAEEMVKEIERNRNDAITKFTELDKLYSEFLSIKDKINDPNAGLQALTDLSTAKKNELEAIRSQSDKLFLEISRLKDDSNSFLKDIKNAKLQAEESTNKIKEYEKESQEFKLKIAEIWEIATGSGLSNSFGKRKKELLIGTGAWVLILILGVIGYVALLVWIYHETFRNGTPTIDVAAWYRLTLTLPVLFLIGFASIQYSKERNILEKYAFKSATALALEAYTYLLTDKFVKFEKEIVKFVLNAMTMIYKEPYDKGKKYKINFGINRIFNMGVEENQMEEIQEIMKKAKGINIDI